MPTNPRNAMLCPAKFGEDLTMCAQVIE